MERPRNWDCEACLRAKPPEDPSHILDRGCRLADGGKERARRRKIEHGEKAKAGSSRDPAVAAAGRKEEGPISDDLGSDADVRMINKRT